MFQLSCRFAFLSTYCQILIEFAGGQCQCIGSFICYYCQPDVASNMPLDRAVFICLSNIRWSISWSSEAGRVTAAHGASLRLDCRKVSGAGYRATNYNEPQVKSAITQRRVNAVRHTPQRPHSSQTSEDGGMKSADVPQSAHVNYEVDDCYVWCELYIVNSCHYVGL